MGIADSEDKLNNLSFLDFLNRIKTEIERLRYKKNDDRAYNEALNISWLFKRRLIKNFNIPDSEENTNALLRNAQDNKNYLEPYPAAKTFKKKEECLNSFKDQSIADISLLIYEEMRKSPI